MAQFKTFYIAMTDEGTMQDRLNAFLRAHRVLAVRQRDFPEGWGFCVEWMDGMDFLGLRVYPSRIRANRASLDRFMRKARRYDRSLAEGIWSEAVYQERMTALTAFLQSADTLGWRRRQAGAADQPLLMGERRNASGSNRVQRGGNYNNNAQNCRSANRNNNNPSNRNNNIGFRLCCSAAPQDSENHAVPGALPFACATNTHGPCGVGRPYAEHDAGPSSPNRFLMTTVQGEVMT